MAFERVTRAASIPAVFLALVLVVVSALPAAAITLLRDPDIEHGMNRIAAPILRAAGLSTTRTRIYLVNDSSFNAFVLDNRSIFLNYGLITKVNDVTLVQAVIAHEAAHISNGHLARRTANFQSSRTAAGLGLALAAIAAAASGEAEAGFGVAVGDAERSAAVLSEPYTRRRSLCRQICRSLSDRSRYIATGAGKSSPAVRRAGTSQRCEAGSLFAHPPR